jgi:hypothetical protein
MIHVDTGIKLIKLKVLRFILKLPLPAWAAAGKIYYGIKKTANLICAEFLYDDYISSAAKPCY